MKCTTEARRQVKAWLEGLTQAEREALSAHSITALRLCLTYHASDAVDAAMRRACEATDNVSGAKDGAR